MNKYEAISVGRHQIADPLEKEISRLHDAVSQTNHEVYKRLEENTDNIISLASETKDKVLGIERLVSFENLSEKHDQFVVLSLVNTYYKRAITVRNRMITNLISGINEIASIVSVSDAVLDYSAVEEIEDQEIASKLLLEIACLCNEYAGEYDEEEFSNLTEELTISVKDLKRINKFISENIQMYSIDKWIDLLIGDIQYSNEEGDLTEESVSQEESEILHEVEVFEDYEETYIHIIESLNNMPGKKSNDVKKWISNSKKAISPYTSVVTYNFPKTEVLFTLTGVHFITSEDNVWSMRYEEFDEKNSFITKGSSDKYYDMYVLKNLNGESIEFCVTQGEEQKLHELFCGLKTFPRPLTDEISFRDSIEEKHKYCTLLIRFLKIGELNPFTAMRLFSEVLGSYDEDELLFRQLLEECENAEIFTGDEFLNDVYNWILERNLASRFSNTYALIRDLVFELQIATGSTRTFSDLHMEVLRHIYSVCFTESTKPGFDKIIEIFGMQYRYLQEYVDIGVLRQARRNIDAIEDLTFSQLDVRSSCFWSDVDKFLESDYGIFTSKEKRDARYAWLREETMESELFYYMQLVGHINMLKSSEDKRKAHDCVENILLNPMHPYKEVGEWLMDAVNKFYGEEYGPSDMMELWRRFCIES